MSDEKRDVISSLHTSVSDLFLEDLDMKSLINFSAVSKQWRRRWLAGPDFIISDEYFKTQQEFLEFLRKLLLTDSVTKIRKLEVRAGSYVLEPTDTLKELLAGAAVKNVEELIVRIVDEEFESDLVGGYEDASVEFPDSLFTSNVLHSLLIKFGNRKSVSLVMPQEIGTINLKRVELENMCVVNSSALSDLISISPLESLVLVKVKVLAGDLNIHSETLKHLQIRNHRGNQMMMVQKMANGINISTPNLESFICFDFMDQIYSINRLSSIGSAHLDILPSHQDDPPAITDVVKHFLSAFQNAKYLKITSTKFIEMLAEFSPKFPNAQSIEVTVWPNITTFKSLTALLRGSYSCKEFVIKPVTPESYLDADFSKIDSCRLPYLDTLKIHNFKGTGTDESILKFFTDGERVNVGRIYVLWQRRSFEDVPLFNATQRESIMDRFSTLLESYAGEITFM